MKHVVWNLVQGTFALFVLYLLFVILFPWPRPARENARRSQCQSNLKQLMLAVGQYSQDNDGFLPRYNVSRVGVSASGPLRLTHWTKSIDAYAKNPQLFLCPSDSNTLGTDYYLNRFASGQSKSKFKSSANSVLLCEGPDIADSSRATATAPLKSGDPPTYARHLGGSNYVFVDGHVKWLQSTRAPTNLPAERGGFTFNF